MFSTFGEISDGKLLIIKYHGGHVIVTAKIFSNSVLTSEEKYGIIK